MLPLVARTTGDGACGQDGRAGLASAGEDEPVASGAIGSDRPGGGVAERRVDPNENPRIGL